MNGGKHTPGPWEYRPASNYTGFAIAPLGRLPTLAAVDEKRSTVTVFNFPRETEANARLIAAAPDGLAVAEAFVAHYPMGINPFLDQAYRDARAFIAKAKATEPSA